MYDAAFITALPSRNPHAEEEYEMVRGVPVKKNARVRSMYWGFAAAAFIVINIIVLLLQKC
jgi:hypothetical protein